MTSEWTVDKTDTSQTAENYEMTVEEWLALRKLPEECRQVGMVYFARSPGSDVWVCEAPSITRLQGNMEDVCQQFAQHALLARSSIMRPRFARVSMKVAAIAERKSRR
jgi:hypothetical protein